MLEQHRALNRTFTRMKEQQRQLHARLVTRPAAPLTADPDKVFDDGPGLPKDERRREFFAVLHDVRRRQALYDQEIARFPKMPKHLLPKELVDFYLDGIKEFGLFA